MRYLVLTDLHANLHALDAVLADAKAIGYDQVLVLGPERQAAQLASLPGGKLLGGACPRKRSQGLECSRRGRCHREGPTVTRPDGWFRTAVLPSN